MIAVYDLGGGRLIFHSALKSRACLKCWQPAVIPRSAAAMISIICWRITFASRRTFPDRSDNRVQRELLDAAIAAKIALSDADSVTVNVAGWQGEISREQFNELIAPLVKRTPYWFVVR